MNKRIEDVIDRIHKLLAMSCSDNEHEAAIAAERARQLMAEYHLVEAELRVEDPTLPTESVVDEVRLDPGAPRAGAKSAWKMRIASAVAKSQGCHPYTMGRETVVFGRESATQAWRYITMYLIAEVERLCETAWETDPDGKKNVFSSPRAWRHAFKLGAAQSISERLKKAKKEAVTPVAATSTALAVIAKDQAEVDAAYATMSAGWRVRKTTSQISDHGAYSAGREAGTLIALGGERRGLASGQRRIK